MALATVPQFYVLGFHGTTIAMFGRTGRQWLTRRTAVVISLIGVGAVFTVWRLAQPTPWYEDLEPREGISQSLTQSGSMESRIAAFCGNCHALPSPESFVQDAWHDEVLRGYEFYARSGMTHLDPPPVLATVDYFRSRAPREMQFPIVQEAEEPLHADFVIEQRASGPEVSVPPALTHLRWARLVPDNSPVLLACDMRSGRLTAIDVNRPGDPPEVLARLDNPCHVEPADLDQDGRIDLVVADLGSSVPYDHDLGRVVWLRADREQENRFEPVVIASDLGRVADVRPGDLDEDGDIDLVVAVFGLHRTGQVLVLENVSQPGDPVQFLQRQIDPRPGAIHVPLVDLNNDGQIDFLALISQEYECVEAFLNRGNDATAAGRLAFNRHRLWTGPDLTFGSSGIEPVDLDQDGDMDVLYTNGDAFDNNYVNPSHGIQWLENLDGTQFAYHRLTDFVGACRALAGDVDLDGDLDIVATAWLPEEIKPARLMDQPLACVLCLEQTAPGVFVRHTLKTGKPRFPALELADFDRDGDLDFAVGTNTGDTAQGEDGLSIWWNELKQQPK